MDLPFPTTRSLPGLCRAVLLGAWGFGFSAQASDWEVGPGFRSKSLPVLREGRVGFTLLSVNQTGVQFTNVLSEAGVVQNQIRLNGSGLALGDVDGDGSCDLYLCGLENGNRLYRNQGGFRFEDVTKRAGVGCPGQFSTGAVFADVDGDGDLDLLVTSVGGGARLFLNDGKARFDEASDAGLIRRFGSKSMALADIDGNGTLDLYVANYQTTTIRDTGMRVLVIDGRRTVMAEDRHRFEITPDGQFLEYGEPDVLYLNDGKGHFTPLSWTNGAFLDEAGKALGAPLRDWGLSAMFRDINGDGAPDLYVCNDFFSPDRFWINDGRGRFRAVASGSLRSTSLGAMAVDFADINRDGFDDFIVVDMMAQDHRLLMTQREPNAPSTESIEKFGVRPQFQRNTLHLNRGDGTFAEIAQLSGVEASGWSWGVAFVDVDLDGFEDLLIIAGHGYDTLDADSSARVQNLPREQSRRRILEYPPHPAAKVAFRNRGDLTFEDVGATWGFDTVDVSHGMALGDLDNDGDLDVVVNNFNGPARIYRNDASAPRLAVKLKGMAPNTRGIGAKVKVTGGPVTQSQEMICGGRYCSGDEPLRVFACGAAASLAFEVTWRSGRRSHITNALPNRLYEVDESGVGAPPAPATNHFEQAPPFFTDVSSLLHHAHVDEPFNDFDRQPLLPGQLSQLGPGVSWGDLDGDGWDDLVIGSGKGGQLAAFHNEGGKGFKRLADAPFGQPVTRDQTTILSWPKGPGQAALLAGSANYEDGLSMGSCVRKYDLSSRKVEDNLPGQESSTGPLALADLDRDGQLDLLVGGRVIAGRFPEPASSMVFRGRAGGKFVPDAENSKRLAGVGLVSGAVFSDLDGDGDVDLVLACDWGPLRVFRNDGGQLSAWDCRLSLPGQALNPPPPTLSQLTGWWNGVTTGDFDGDGRMDIVAGNWGRNSKYQRYRGQSLRLCYGDWRGNGNRDIIETVFDKGMGKKVPLQALDVVGSVLPFVIERYPTFRSYSECGVDDLLGDRPRNELQANWLETSVLFNRGDHFEVRSLPVEAQMSPAFGVCVGDMDGDGDEDVFLGENYFAVNPDTSRYDAGRGLWLRGDGRGGFSPVPGQESGVKVYGEQRGAALCDYDGDGRVDLVVTQNAAETKLYRNTGAKPGLRVRLVGPPGNPCGIGAALRLRFGSKEGPLREIHAGSGYWSQDSVVQVLATPQPPTHLWVRWPGGKTTLSPLPPQVREITVDPAGAVKATR